MLDESAAGGTQQLWGQADLLIKPWRQTELRKNQNLAESLLIVPATLLEIMVSCVPEKSVSKP